MHWTTDPMQPSGSSRRGQFSATVLANTPLCDEHYRLTLAVENFPASSPGQFVQLLCRARDESSEREFEWSAGERIEDWSADLVGPSAFLRRPFSLAGRRTRNGSTELDLIHRAVGVATNWMSRLKVGDDVELIGPLGNTFALPRDGQPAILVGGGVGIPPMLYLAERLAGRSVVAFCGALSRRLLPLTVTEAGSSASTDAIPSTCVAEFARHGLPSIVSTDDGSYGYRGYITQALERYLDSGQCDQPMVYTCGPEPMMRRVAEIALSRGLECQVAAERAMACGMGTCQSCCIRVRKDDPSQPPMAGSDWCYRLTCTDGPVFRAAELLW